MFHELNRSCTKPRAFNQSLFLQGFEMAHDAIRRLDVEAFADLSNRRTKSAAFDFVLDKIVNLPLPLGQLAKGGHELLLWRNFFQENHGLQFSIETHFHVNLSILDFRSHIKSNFCYFDSNSLC